MTTFSQERDDFMMDFENAILEEWDARQGIPQGRRRFENPEWAVLVQRNVYPNHSDVNWEQYVEWVQQGGGDEHFRVQGDVESISAKENRHL